MKWKDGPNFPEDRFDSHPAAVQVDDFTFVAVGGTNLNVRKKSIDSFKK